MVNGKKIVLSLLGGLLATCSITAIYIPYAKKKSYKEENQLKLSRPQPQEKKPNKSNNMWKKFPKKKEKVNN